MRYELFLHLVSVEEVQLPAHTPLGNPSASRSLRTSSSSRSSRDTETGTRRMLREPLESNPERKPETAYGSFRHRHAFKINTISIR